MKFIADLQIHSRYSRATSKDMVLEEIDRWAGNKGILLMGTGDFTHPAWVSEIKKKLEPAEPGLFKLKKEFKLPTIRGEMSETRFMLTCEVSSIYSKQLKGKAKRVYRVHNLIFAPDIETVEKINTQLSWIGNIASDGRPILGLDSEELAKIVFSTNPKAVLVPAHAWTPWFSVFGSMSGFDNLEDCYGEYAKNIFAIETGLSSDPAMNWRLSVLDNISLISNSDSHSLKKIGREANIFDAELSYGAVFEAIKSRDPKKFLATIEFFPEEGKYHFDGHRLCGVVFKPEETKKHKNICPKCGKPLTIGVLNRVYELADREEIKTEFKDNKYSYSGRIPYYNLVPLNEIIAKSYNLGTASKRIDEEYGKMIKLFGSEFKILLETTTEEMTKVGVDKRIVSGIKAVREGKIIWNPPGYDGEYGNMEFVVPIAAPKKEEVQKRLF
ncbi:DNA helicase UvrD [Candidatus Wolfebacteria bacterium]|nr:DNA helicase UvrD [Candidatus Wolfebacteria bacterium]